MLIPKHFENLNILHENTMPDRSYYIPAGTRREDLVEHREQSDRFQLLNGLWDFRYYGCVYDMKDEFWREDHTLTADWSRLPVPSVWQMHGFDQHQYTNESYPFPLDPPYVPLENPCGAYRRVFSWHKDERAPKVYLNFEGVDSCFYVWLNGTYVGYSQVSHATSEFDVTSLLKEGENLLAVLVLKWCDGSYLEDQDKFRMSGIFRDVYLLSRPAECIFDYFIRTRLDLAAGEAEVEISFSWLHDAVPVQITIEDAQGAEAARLKRDACAEGPAVLQLRNIHLWSAETPYLYTVLLETPDEVIGEQLGLREVSVRDGIFYYNGEKIKFHGVNRHDSDPVTGFAISPAQMHRDLTLMKEHNVNAVRTSHYPNAPVFYQLCDRYGFYVLDEADNESHGTNQGYGQGQEWGEESAWIADNPAWIPATVDRVQKCVIRDKNRPCVFGWSMGNECSYGCTFEAAQRWAKDYDGTRIIHYEGAWHALKGKAYDYSCLDFYSRMYMGFDDIHAYFSEKDAEHRDSRCDAPSARPLFLCEYSHAMGNGPGDLEDYFQIFQQYEGACGGMVWEWCDHAIDKGRDKHGSRVYFYGGDHGEYPHFGSFCMDGLVYPDRRPHTGLLEFKNVYRPVRIAACDPQTGVLRLHNYLAFLNLQDVCTMQWEVTRDGDLIASGEGPLPDIAPGGEGELRLPLPRPADGRCYLKVEWHLKEAQGILPAGHVLGFDEVPLPADGKNLRTQALLQAPFAPDASRGTLRIEEDDHYLTIRTEHFRYTYDKFKGLFAKMTNRNQVLLDEPMQYNIWRAPTDNDRRIRFTWENAQYDRAAARCYDTRMTEGEERGRQYVQIDSDLSLAAVYMQRILNIRAQWRVWADGSIDVNLTVKKDPVFPRLPRFGLRLVLPEELANVEYYGLGPVENYIDKRRASYHGRFAGTVDAFFENYTRPQENGSRGDTDHVTLSGEGVKLSVAADTPFSFSVSRYTQEELTQKAHNFELVPSGHVILCVDYRQDAIGSNSCGPAPKEIYQFLEKEFTFSFGIRIRD